MKNWTIEYVETVDGFRKYIIEDGKEKVMYVGNLADAPINWLVMMHNKGINDVFKKALEEGAGIRTKAIKLEVNVDGGKEQQENEAKTAKWELWGGWRGNHDKRIEHAKCSNCGFEHPTVYSNLDNLSKVCPNCGSKMEIKEV